MVRQRGAGGGSRQGRVPGAGHRLENRASVGREFGGPIVVAGKVFLLSGMANVVCLDAATGKMLWLRSNNYHELARDDEQRAHPEIFQEIKSLAARLAEVNAAFTSSSPPQIEAVDGREEYKEKAGLERKLYALMRQVNRQRYALPKGQDVGYSGLTRPATAIASTLGSLRA